MARFTVNHNLDNCVRKEIDDCSMLGISNDVIVVLFGSETYDVCKYYTSIKKLLASGTRVVLVYIGEGTEKFNLFSNLMCLYERYDIYKEKTLTFISEVYVEDILKRTPTIQEVQAFVDHKVAAYGDLDTIMIGITSLIKEGNFAGLKEFIENNVLSIEGLVETLNELRSNAAQMSSGEITKKIELLMKELKDVQDRCTNEEKLRKKAEHDIDMLNNKVKDGENKVKELDAKVKVASGSGSSGSIIQAYQTINVSNIKCKAKCILYIKEVSRIPYINTMVKMLTSILENHKKKWKLLIYDTTGMTKIYGKMFVVRTEEFIANRSNLVGMTPSFVVAEPNPMILESVLVNDQPSPFDIVIVYDRAGQLNDVVEGNNVRKMWVISSKNEYAKLKADLKISDEGSIITRVNSGISKDTLDIPEVEDFAKLSDSAKLMRYMRLTCSGNTKLLMKELEKKVMLDNL